MESANEYLDEKIKEKAIQETKNFRKRNEEHTRMLANMAQLAMQQQYAFYSQDIGEALSRATQKHQILQSLGLPSDEKHAKSNIEEETENDESSDEVDSEE